MSRVLMVDDAGLLRLLEASFLRRLGCDIVRAAGWSDLLDNARRNRPDLIMIDADRPEIDGATCLRTLKSDITLRRTPVLVLSDPARLGLCFEAGADAALSRPLTPGALETAVGTLGGIGPRRGLRRSARLTARVVPEPGGAPRRCRVKDISRTGLFLALPELYALDTTLDISVHLPAQEGGASIHARGVVVRQVPTDPDSHLIAGVGVRFVGLEPGMETLLAGFVGRAAGRPSPAPTATSP